MAYLFGTHLGLLDYYFTGYLPHSVDLSVSYLRLGREVSVAFLPGETTSRLGHDILKYMGHKENFIVGLSDGNFGYLIKPDEYNSGRNNGYEEDVTLNRKIGERVRLTVMNAKKVILDLAKLNDMLDDIGNNR
jgi:hypothetical protein